MKKFALLSIIALSAVSTAHAQFLSNPTPIRTTTENSIVYTKELTGFANYGSDGAADILYTGDTGTWTFNVTSADLSLLSGTPVFTAVLALDDHYTVPINTYSFGVAINGTPVSTSATLSHGSPSDDIFTNWANVNVSGVPLTVGTNTIRITNTSNNFSSDPNWIGVDRIRLTLPTAIVPEPSTLGLLALPLLALGMRYRRAKK